MTLEGEESFFEIHITVANEALYEFLLYCNEKGCAKDFAVGPWLYSEARSEEASNRQLMFTRTVKQSFGAARALATETAAELESRGIAVRRIKLEVPAQHEFVVRARQALPEAYYEFHFKVRVASQAEHEQISAVSRQHHASFSYNAFGSTPDRVLVAQRVHCAADVPYSSALAARQAYIDTLQAAELQVDTTGSGVHYEFVVHDSNPQLDAGFVPAPLRLVK